MVIRTSLQSMEKHGSASVTPTPVQRKTARSSKSKELRSRDNYFNIITQNVNGLKNDEKIDGIVNRMENNHIDIYLAQETWLEDEGEQLKIIEINQTIIFFHGNDNITSSRGRGGVAIFLGPRAKKAWQEAGSALPEFKDIPDDIPRIIGIKLRIRKARKHCNLFVCSAYHPHSGMVTETIDNFYNNLTDFLDKVPENYNIIIGADTNTPLGTIDNKSDPNSQYIGKYGMKQNRNNQSYCELLAILKKYDLRAANTDFFAKRYDTWSGSQNSNFEGDHQLDYFLTANNLRRNTIKCKRSHLGAESDHHAVKLRLRFYFGNPNKNKICNKKVTRPDWTQLKNQEIAEKFQNRVDEYLAIIPEDNNITTLHEAIQKAANETLPQKTRKRQDWFTPHSDKILEAIKERNKALTVITQSPSIESLQIDLKEKRKYLKNIIKSAKMQWVESIVNQLAIDNYNSSPKASWEEIKRLQKGFKGHHKKKVITNFVRPDGTSASNNKENADILTKHFEKVYNGNKSEINIEQILSEIKQRETFFNLDEPPTIDELEIAIKLTVADKAPGPSGISPRAFKNLSQQGKLSLLQIITKIYKGEQDPIEFHCASLKILHKKGAQSNPSNWRGLALKETSAKLLSSIINQRLLKIMAIHGVENQYGAQKGKGCRDGIFTLRAALETRRLHNQETWVIFADLIKAYDTADHDLLFALLPHYGVPPQLTRIIKQLYTDMHVNLEYENEKRKIPYTIGVQQGDNMAPVLFLFVMQAFAETLEKNWKEWGLTAPEYKYMNRGTNFQGRFFNQATTAQGTVFDLFYLLFVDDGAFLFENKEQLAKGAELLYKHFRKFGLQMHVGRFNETSKTEVMFFPPNLQKQENADTATTTFPVNDGHLKMSENFTYLGVNTSPDLKDNNEIKKRIQKATSQLGALKNLFREKSISIAIKHKVFMAIPISTLLWGCESWTLNEHNKRLLRSFQHKSIRSILNINIYEVQDYKITNDSLRQNFCNMPDIIDIIKKRQMNWISAIAKMPTQRLPRKLLASWTKEPRKKGRPQSTYRNSYAECISTLLPDLPRALPLTEWITIAASQKWTELKNKWFKSTTAMSTVNTAQETWTPLQLYWWYKLPVTRLPA